MDHLPGQITRIAPNRLAPQSISIHLQRNRIARQAGRRLRIGRVYRAQDRLHLLEAQIRHENAHAGNARHAVPAEQNLRTPRRRFCGGNKNPRKYCGKQIFMRSIPARETGPFMTDVARKRHPCFSGTRFPSILHANR